MGNEGRAVVRRTRGEWQAIMSRFERSGQGRREFCEAEGLVLGTFSWWCRELGRSGARRFGAVRGVGGWPAGCVGVGRGAGAGRRDGAAGSAAAFVLSLGGGCRIWLCRRATDMRRSFDGLSATVRNDLGADPSDGSWFVFVNRRRTMLKVLAFDGDGWCIWSKRLESGRFADGTAPAGPSSAGRRCWRCLRARTSRWRRQRKRYRRAA